ncbi:hypothetical protein [Actinacidiphila oryziradicis]|nr:hypothetical protein [Actinacidiphila oryziradicis]
MADTAGHRHGYSPSSDNATRRWVASRSYRLKDRDIGRTPTTATTD